MNRRDNGQILAFFGVVVIAIAVLLTGLSYKETLATIKKSVDLYDASYDLTKVKDTDMVESSINMLFGQYANYSGDSYYVLPLMREETVYYIGLKVSAEKNEVLEEISSETLRYVYGIRDNQPEAVTIKGRLKKMDDRNIREFRKWFDEQHLFDIGDTGEDKMLAYYVGEEADEAGVDIFVGGVIGIVAGVMMVINGIRMYWTGKEQIRTQTQVVINGVSYPKERFAVVNSFIENQQMVVAIQEISNITGVDLEQAGMIARKWNVYYF